MLSEKIKKDIAKRSLNGSVVKTTLGCPKQNESYRNLNGGGLIKKTIGCSKQNESSHQRYEERNVWYEYYYMCRQK